jgi:hypothetical protein
MGTPKPELRTTMAPPLAGSSRVNGHRDYVIKAVLHGLTGPLDGRTYTDVMMPQGFNDDEWIAAIASYVRRSFGNAAGFVTPADVARVRAATAARKEMWTVAELVASLPVLLHPDGWKATASHNSAAAGDGLTLTGWNAGAPQEAGMWFQIELPKPANVSEIQFQSPPPGGTGAAVGNGGAPVNTAEGPGFPRGYKVELSSDGSSWTQVAEGAAQGASTAIAFTPAAARFVRVTLTRTVESSPAFSVQGLRVYRAPGQ